MINFRQATISILYRTIVPTVDMFTNGGATAVSDKIGDRAAAAEIACIEAAELFGAIKDAERGGMTEEQIAEIVAQSKDVALAKKLLADPSATVVLDGEETTADDDAPATGAENGKNADPNAKGKK